MGLAAKIMLNQVTVSFVVPVYSGQDFLERLALSIKRIHDDWENVNSPLRVGELILVDDASIDRSGEIVDNLAAKEPWIVALHLSRNYGQHAATIAGILHSSGDWIVTLDEDFQHPPEKVEDLLRFALSQCFDVVYARPTGGRIHGKIWRDGTSRRVKKFMEWMTGTRTLHMVNSFRLLRGSIARATASVCTHNTYFDIALTWFTQRVGAVEMTLRDDRFVQTGKSGYDIGKLVAHGQRMLFSSQIRFLAVGLWIGVALFMTSVIAGVFVASMRLLVPESISVDGWASLFLLVCMSTGLISVMLGLCLQYLSTLVLKVHGRPTFFTIDRSKDREIIEWLEARLNIASPSETA